MSERRGLTLGDLLGAPVRMGPLGEPYADVQSLPVSASQSYVRHESFTCPRCGGLCSRDEADIGIGIMYGPWGCACGWLETDD